MLGYLNSGMDHHGQPLGMYNMLLLKSEEGLRVAYVFGIVAGILQAILNTLLLFGVHKENKILVSIWLAAYFVIFVQSVLLLVVSFFQYLPNPYYQVGAVIDIGLTMYFLLVVRSYRHSLADGHNRQQNAANLYYTENSNIKRMPLA
jgi:type III secretory pathway component EscS